MVSVNVINDGTRDGTCSPLFLFDTILDHDHVYKFAGKNETFQVKSYITRFVTTGTGINSTRTNEFIRDSRQSIHEGIKRKKEKFLLPSFNRFSPLDEVSFRGSIPLNPPSRISSLVELRMGGAFPTPFGRRRCILHATAYYMPAVTLRRCLIVGKNSFLLPRKTPGGREDFPHFRFLLLRNSVPEN